MKTYFRLFGEFFRISLFVIGGGYAILAVADSVFSKLKWIKEGELLDELPVFQMVPGIIATHTAVYVGRKVAGWKGAVVAVTAVALPSVVIFTAVSMGYDAIPVGHPLLASAFVGLRSALTGIIGATVWRSFVRAERDVFFFVALFAALAALVAGAPVWTVLVAAMLAGLASAFARPVPGGSAGPVPGSAGSASAFARPVPGGSAGYVPGGSRRFRSAAWLPILYFLKYGFLCFGGGFVLVPMYIEDFVGPAAPALNVTAEEFSNLMALSQMTPGPIGVNGATYFGFRLAGVPGALLASAALLLPGSALVYLALASLDRFKSSRIVRGVLRGARPASIALMLAALWAFLGMSALAGGRFNAAASVIVAACFAATLRRLVGPVLLIVASALAAMAVA